MVSNLLDEAQDNPDHSPAHIRKTFPWSPRSLGLIGCRTPPPWPSPARSRPSLEQVNWVTVPHSRQRSSFLVRACVLSDFSRVQLFVTLWTAAHQAPRSMEFSRQEYWSGLPFPTLEIVPTQGSNPRFLLLLHWQAIFYDWVTWEAQEWLDGTVTNGFLINFKIPPGKKCFSTCSLYFRSSANRF